MNTNNENLDDEIEELFNSFEGKYDDLEEEEEEFITGQQFMAELFDEEDYYAEENDDYNYYQEN